MGFFSRKGSASRSEDTSQWTPGCETCHSMMDCAHGWQHKFTGSGTCLACGSTSDRLNLCSNPSPI
jgi:hypothetical protein